MELLSASELGAIQSVAQSGMASTAIVLVRSVIETDDGQESVWATSGIDVPCWVHEFTPAGQDIGGVSGAVALVELFSIRLPVGTEISSGDHIVVGSLTYIVEHTNDADTYPAWLDCSCRAFA